MIIVKLIGNDYGPLHDRLVAAGVVPTLVESENGEWRFYFESRIDADNAQPILDTADMIIKEIEVAALDDEYQPHFRTLQVAWAAANLDSNTALATELQADYAALKAEYQTKREMITNGN